MTVKLSARHAYLHRPPPGGGIFGAALCQAPGGERESDEILRVSSLTKSRSLTTSASILLPLIPQPHASALFSHHLFNRQKHRALRR